MQGTVPPYLSSQAGSSGRSPLGQVIESRMGGGEGVRDKRVRSSPTRPKAKYTPPSLEENKALVARGLKKPEGPFEVLKKNNILRHEESKTLDPTQPFHTGILSSSPYTDLTRFIHYATSINRNDKTSVAHLVSTIFLLLKSDPHHSLIVHSALIPLLVLLESQFPGSINRFFQLIPDKRKTGEDLRILNAVKETKRSHPLWSLIPKLRCLELPVLTRKPISVPVDKKSLHQLIKDPSTKRGDLFLALSECIYGVNSSSSPKTTRYSLLGNILILHNHDYLLLPQLIGFIQKFRRLNQHELFIFNFVRHFGNTSSRNANQLLGSLENPCQIPVIHDLFTPQICTQQKNHTPKGHLSRFLAQLTYHSWILNKLNTDNDYHNFLHSLLLALQNPASPENDTFIATLGPTLQKIIDHHNLDLNKFIVQLTVIHATNIGKGTNSVAKVFGQFAPVLGLLNDQPVPVSKLLVQLTDAALRTNSAKIKTGRKKICDLIEGVIKHGEKAKNRFLNELGGTIGKLLVQYRIKPTNFMYYLRSFPATTKNFGTLVPLTPELMTRKCESLREFTFQSLSARIKGSVSHQDKAFLFAICHQFAILLKDGSIDKVTGDRIVGLAGLITGSRAQFVTTYAKAIASDLKDLFPKPTRYQVRLFEVLENKKQSKRKK